MPRSRATREIPPPLELECLRTLWRLREASVHDVRQALTPRRSLAYTTVMTLLERLVRKGAVTRRKAGRAFLYAPVAERDALRRLAVRELVDLFFEGAESELAEYLRRPHSVPAAGPASDSEPGLDPALL
jgi:predicted transcriptional regulator